MSQLTAGRPPIAAVIITKNEEQHIARCLESVRADCAAVIVVDSGSTDRTAEIATALGAQVYVNPFVNHAAQFNHGVGLVPPGIDWVLRIDADETLAPGWAAGFADLLARQPEVKGVSLRRLMRFQGQLIRWGGCATWQLRLFDRRFGQCEARWMDEHIAVDGPVAQLNVRLVDDNLNPLAWWTDKHNAYSSKEAVEILNLEYGFFPARAEAQHSYGKGVAAKRFVKEKIYARLPSGIRAALYFAYRYILRLGFLDGRRGASFHVLQGLWYRYLVDAKVREVKDHMRRTGGDVVPAIKHVLNITL
jgi:glycosyltransferase involved in cell wall biosynthesis